MVVRFAPVGLMSSLRWARALAIGLPSLMLVACSGEVGTVPRPFSETFPTGGNAGAANGLGGTGSATGAVGTTGGSGAASGGGAEEPQQYGSVTFISANRSYEELFLAYFHDEPPSSRTRTDCQAWQNDECIARMCPGSTSDRPNTVPDAGTLYLVSSDLQGWAMLVPEADGYYGTAQLEFDNRFFTGGEEISIDASGDEVPEFSVNTVFPEPLRLAAPAPTEGVVAATPGEPLTLTFAAGLEQTHLWAQGSHAAVDALYEFACSLPADAGVVTIPGEALALMPADFEISLYSLRRIEVAAGNYNVVLRFAGNVVDAGETAVSIVVAPTGS